MSKNLEQIGTTEGVFIPKSPVTLCDLFGGQIPQQSKYANDDVKGSYHGLTVRFLHPQLRTFGQQRDLLVACPPLRGKELQQAFHFAAPSKTFGIDSRDTQNDWHNLYNDPIHEQRLKDHQTIPNWELFEPYREQIRTFIGNDFDGKASLDDFVVPVVRISQQGDKGKWNFTELDEEQKQSLVRQATDPLPDSTQYLPILGPVFVAAFSPEMTASWGKKLNYRLKNNGGTQDMGSTQAFALSLAKSSTLLDTPLVERLMIYAETGELPPVNEVAKDIGEGEPEEEKTPLPTEEIIFTEGIKFINKFDISKWPGIKWEP